MASEPQTYLTTDNLQTSVTTTTLQKYIMLCGDSLTDVQWLLYLQDHALVIARLQDSLGRFLYDCLMQ